MRATDPTPIFDAKSAMERDKEVSYPALFFAHCPDPAHNGMLIPLGAQHVLGRETLSDPLMSRQHVRFISRGRTVEVEDMGSTNGTFVNGNRVGSAPVAIDTQSIIRAGNTLMSLDWLDQREQIESLEPFVGATSPMRKLYAELRRAAPSKLSVLLTGGTGTGKELAAQALHKLSGRKGELIAVNCAAIAPSVAESALFGHQKGAFTNADSASAGYFEQADKGTLFLDEISELPAALQAKLLRALESGEIQPVGGRTKPVDVRLVTATNVDLSADGFRRDLFARVAGVTIKTPSLDEHRADVPGIFRRFVHPHEVDVQALERLALRSWPLNVREVRNVANQALLTATPGQIFTLGNMPAGTLDSPSTPNDEANVPSNMRAPAKDVLLKLLSEHKGNVARVAKTLGRERKQVYRWLEGYGIDANSFR